MMTRMSNRYLSSPEMELRYDKFSRIASRSLSFMVSLDVEQIAMALGRMVRTAISSTSTYAENHINQALRVREETKCI